MYLYNIEFLIINEITDMPYLNENFESEKSLNLV